MRDQKTYAIIGAAMEVHKELGSAFLKLFIMKLYGENFVSKELLLSPSPLFKFYIKEER